MSVERSRSAELVGDEPKGAAMGTWGLWLTLIVMAMFVAGLAAAALYLETGQPRAAVTGEPDQAWPPEGIEAPGWGLALSALGLTAVGAVAGTLAWRRLQTASTRPAGLLMAVSGAALTSAVLLLIADLNAAPFRWFEHAYTSIYWIHTGGAITFLSTGVLIVAAVLVQMLIGVVDEDRHLELTNATIYLWFALGISAVLLALVHLLPVVAGGA